MPLENNIKPPTLAEIEEALKLKEALRESGVSPEPESKADNTPVISEAQKIEDLVREFEAKTNTEEVKKAPSTPSTTSDAPKMVQFVIKLSGGTLKEKYAEYTLFGFVIVAMSISFFLLFRGDKKVVPQQLPDDLIERMKNIPGANPTRQ